VGNGCAFCKLWEEAAVSRAWVADAGMLVRELPLESAADQEMSRFVVRQANIIGNWYNCSGSLICVDPNGLSEKRGFS
jgi:hypothetical protein